MPIELSWIAVKRGPTSVATEEGRASVQWLVGKSPRRSMLEQAQRTITVKEVTFYRCTSATVANA